jgi:hypothetical protein
MRTILSTCLSLLTFTAFGQNDPNFAMTLNQRSFNNPAALCPYCPGSPFLALAHRYNEPLDNAWQVGIGNDNNDFIRGAWDISYSGSKSEQYRRTGVGMRYAGKFRVGNWMSSAGVRVRYSHLRLNGNESATPAISTNALASDFGLFITDLNGTYFGFSASDAFNTNAAIANYRFMTGTKKDLSARWDVLPELLLTYQSNQLQGNIVVPFRFAHRVVLGVGYQSSITGNGIIIRTGVSTKALKWLVQAEQHSGSWAVETGFVFRIISSECNGTSCNIPRTWYEFGTRD